MIISKICKVATIAQNIRHKIYHKMENKSLTLD